MINIPHLIIDEIIHQAQAELPNEACGLLVGKENNVERRFAMTNVDASPEHFSFDPAEQFKAYRSARADDLKIIANYHSHPQTPARPSVEDIRLAYDPDILYIIVSLAKNKSEIKAYRIRHGEVETVQIEINH